MISASRSRSVSVPARSQCHTRSEAGTGTTPSPEPDTGNARERGRGRGRGRGGVQGGCRRSAKLSPSAGLASSSQVTAGGGRLEDAVGCVRREDATGGEGGRTEAGSRLPGSQEDAETIKWHDLADGWGMGSSGQTGTACSKSPGQETRAEMDGGCCLKMGKKILQ